MPQKAIEMPVSLLENWLNEVDLMKNRLDDIEDAIALVLARKRDETEGCTKLAEVMSEFGVSKGVYDGI